VETFEGGATQYFFGCDSSSTSTFAISVTGDYINGLVFRGVDGTAARTQDRSAGFGRMRIRGYDELLCRPHRALALRES